MKEEREGVSEKKTERGWKKERESAKWKAERKTHGNGESDEEREIRGNRECDKKPLLTYLHSVLHIAISPHEQCVCVCTLLPQFHAHPHH